MPVSGTSDAIPEHIQLLEQHFLTRFPFHICRAEIFLFKPDDKMKPSKYFSHMIQKINKAQLLRTPVLDIMTSFLATNCPDLQLCLKLLVTDYTKLNKFVKRPIHPFPSATEIMQSIPKDAKFFAKQDSVHGYFPMALDEESSFLTTFLIPSGRYIYLRAPMGLSSSSDKWCCYSDFFIEGCEFAKKIVDDLLICTPSLEILDSRILQILEPCANINVTISQKKFTIGIEISFAGFLISDQGIKPDPEKTIAIASFPSPKNITNLRSFLGLANQLAFFLPDFSHLMWEMRKLLSTKNAFLWLYIHKSEFTKLKKILTGVCILIRNGLSMCFTTWAIVEVSRGWIKQNWEFLVW